MVFSTTAIYAQGNRGMDKDPHAIAKEQTEMLKKRLNLTPDQEAQILKLNEEFAIQRQSIRAQKQEERMQMRSAMKETFEAQDAQMKEILTEQQYATFQEMRQKRQRRRAGKMRQNQE